MADADAIDIEKTAACPITPGSKDSEDTFVEDLSKPIAIRRTKASWFSSFSFGRIGRDPLVGDTITRTLEDCEKGYPQLACFLSSDPNFQLYRSFGYLHFRVLLDSQAELVELERDLDELDAADVVSGHGDRLESKGRDDSEAKEDASSRPRKQIVAGIQQKLLAYDELLLKAREISALQRPVDRDYRSVRTWFRNKEPICEDERDFIKCKEDIVTLRSGRECAAFDGFIEGVLKKLDSRLTRRIFCTPELRAKTKDKHIHYYSPSRVDILVLLIITTIIFVLLVLPVIAMYELTSFGNRQSTFRAIGVLVVFTMVFAAAMGALTKARRHELFAASAAYCAVLVVFISNFGGSTAY